jgi:hypothetical protein
MPLLTELENLFGWGLQIFRAHGAANDQLYAPAKAETQRQRRGISVESPSQKKIRHQAVAGHRSSKPGGMRRVCIIIPPLILFLNHPHWRCPPSARWAGCGSCTTAHAQVTLADLQAGGTITSGDLIFSDFADITQTLDTAVPLSDITVSAIDNGIRFQTSDWSLSGAGFSYDLAFSFDVSTTDGSRITGNALSITGGYSGSGQSQIAETINSPSHVTLATEYAYLNQGNTGSDQTYDSATFTGQTSLLVGKDLSIFTGTGEITPSIFVSHFDQTFTTVPEPATMALAALGGASLMFFRRRK